MSFDNGKVVRVVLEAMGGPLDHVNVLHYDLNDGSIPGESNNPQDLADRFRDNVIPAYGALFGAGYTIQPVLVQEEKDPLDPNAPRSEWTSGVAHPGTRTPTTDELPPACCVVVKLVSDSIGRRYTGRMFISGESHEGDQASGQWTQAWINSIAAFVNTIPHQPDIAGGAGTASAHWSVYSRTNRAQSQPHYMAHIQTYIIRTGVHWLRSRQV